MILIRCRRIVLWAVVLAVRSRSRGVRITGCRVCGKSARIGTLSVFGSVPPGRGDGAGIIVVVGIVLSVIRGLGSVKWAGRRRVRRGRIGAFLVPVSISCTVPLRFGRGV